MSATALFQYKNLDSTQDLNTRFQDLFQKGIYAGGRLAVNSGAYTVSVTPYSAMTASGMAVYDTESTSVVLSGTGLQYIVIDAVYNDSGAASISVFSTTAAAYATYRSRYILIGTVNMDNLSGSKITADKFSYALRDQITPVADSKFLGYFQTTVDRDNYYPATTSTPTIQRVGDFVICGTSAATAGTLASIGFWTDDGWVDFSDPALVESALTAHINNMVMHTSANQHAALAGTAGTPSGTNPFVTLADTTHLLTADERAAVTDALGAETTPIGEANPFVSRGTIIAVPRVYQVAVAAAGQYVDLTLASLSVDSFNLYLGKQGIDGSGISSAQQYFGIEDAYGAGYVSTVTSYPVYVTNVLDGNSSTVNPSSATSAMGFLSFDSTTTVRLQLSTNIAAGTRLYIRLNQKADLSSLTPNWSGLASNTNFLPAVTAYRNARASYTSAETAQFDTLTVGYLSAAQTNMYFSTTKDGYNNTVSMLVNYNGSALEGSLPVGYKFSRTGTQAGTGSGTYEGTFYANSFEFRCKADNAPVNSGFTFNDTDGLVAHTGGIWTSHSSSGKYGIDMSGELFAQSIDIGSSAAFIETQTALQIGTFTYDQALSFSLHGRAVVLFTAQNTAAITDLDSPLVIHQDVTAEPGYTAGIRNIYIGMADAAPSTTSADSGVMYFGFRNYVGDWMSYIGLGGDKPVEIFQDLVADAQILGKNSATIVFDEAAPAYSFYGARNTGLFYVDTYSNQDVTGDGVPEYTVTNGIGFSIAGKAAFMLARTNNDAVVSVEMAPLLLVQNAASVIGSKPTLNYDISLTEPSDDYNMALRFGYVGYASGFSPDFSLDGKVNIWTTTLVHNNAQLGFGADTMGSINNSLMRLSYKGFSFQNTSAASGTFIGAYTDASSVKGAALVNQSTGQEIMLEAGASAHGTYLRGNVWLTAANTGSGNFRGATLNFGTSETVFLQTDVSNKLYLALGGTPVSNGTVVPDKYLLIGRANAGALTATSWISASGYFAAAADSDASNAPSHTFVDTGTSSNSMGFNYSVSRSVIDTYGDLALRDKLLIYNLTTDPAGYADHAEISYANGAITATKPIAAPGLVLADTDVTPIVSTFGKNLISTYKNLYIRGGYGATTTSDSSSVHITVDQAILTDVNGNGILVSNGTYDINVGADGGDIDTTNRSWDVYAVWLLHRHAGDVGDVGEFVARLSKSNDLASVIGNLVVSDVSHTYTHGLLVGHVYMYSNGSTFCIQPSIQRGNTLRFLFKQDGDTNSSGTCYIADDSSNAFAMYSSASTNALAGIPSTVSEVEVVFIPLLTSGHESIGRIFVHPVPFAGTAGSGEYPITELAFNYYTPDLNNTRWICRGWLHLESANIYIQATAGTPFTISGWRENI